MLEPPPHLLARQHLVAVLAHRRADRLDGEHGVGDTAVVERRAHLFLLPGALALVVDVLDDVLEGLEVSARGVESRALVGLGALAGGNHVGVAGRPPVADEVVHPESDCRGFLDRDLVHHAPAGQEDPVRIEPANLEPRRLLLLAGMVHGEQGQLEAVLLRQLFERRVGFLAVGAVVIDVRDLLALELLESALLLTDVADDGGRLAPVRRGKAEHPREPAPVGRGGHAVAHRKDDDLVHRGFGDELVSDARAVGIHQHRVLALQALVALNALLRIVLSLALLPDELDAVDAAVPLVDQIEVVDEPVGDRDPAGRVRTRPVDQQRNEDALRLG